MATEQSTNPADDWKPDPNATYSKTNYLKVKDGESASIRILNERPRQIFMVRVPVDGKQYPVTLDKGDNELIKKHNSGIKDEDKHLKIKKVNAVNVLDRRDETVKLWEFTETLKGDIHGMVEQWKKLPTGFDIALSRTGTTRFNTRYKVTITPNQVALTTEELALEKVDLNEYYKPNRERLESLLRGEVPKRKEDTNEKAETKAETTTVSATQENPLEDGESIV